MKIIRFDESKLEDQYGGTHEIVDSKVEYVERDGGYTTIYLTNDKGIKWYMIIDDAELKMVRRPVQVPQSDKLVERSNQEIPEDQAEHAKLIDDDVRWYANEYGCGDTPDCDTCELGVSVGLETLDIAFQKGYNTGIGPFGKNDPPTHPSGYLPHAFVMNSTHPFLCNMCGRRDPDGNHLK